MYPKIKIVGFGSRGHVQKPRDRENDGDSDSPIIKSKSYESNIKDDDSTELLFISFP